MPILALTGISVHIGSLPILAGIDLELAAGETIGLAGPNGSGKTSLLMVMATLSRPTSGSGVVLGEPLDQPSIRKVRPQIGLSAHDPGLYPELTLTQNLRLFATLIGRSQEQADSMLSQVGLEAASDRRADQSSNGMQRRVDLARLLLLEPMLLLLDEAHAGLDSHSEMLVDELVERNRSRGGAGVVVSHDHARLRERTDRIVMLDAGRVAV